jgi:hypothetical protein
MSVAIVTTAQQERCVRAVRRLFFSRVSWLWSVTQQDSRRIELKILIGNYKKSEYILCFVSILVFILVESILMA